jgi:hypothetical protein
MTTGWIIVNIVLAVLVSALVAGVSILVPHRLHRHAITHAPRNVALATRAATQRRSDSYDRAQAA